MKKTLLHFLLLFSLFFNITHATMIAIEDECHHESVYEYIDEQAQSSDCGDLCDMHHLFHFMAILDTVLIDFDSIEIVTAFIQKSIHYTPPFKETTIKPPIV